MKHTKLVSILLVVVISLWLVQAQPGHGGGGGPGNGGGGGGGGNDDHGSNRGGRGGRGGGGGCRRWEIPSICRDGEDSHYDDDGCLNCIDLSGDILNGCSLLDIANCALRWSSLPVCDDGEWPQRNNNTCCFNCRPGLFDRCTIRNVAQCAASYIGHNNNTALPYCEDGEEPQYNSSTCCTTCRVSLLPNMTSSDGECTLSKFRTCTSSMPVCRRNEVVIFDGEACCGSCRRPERTCDIASVVRCYASSPLCSDDEEPLWLDGECCPSCILPPLPNSNCTNCNASDSICVRDYDTTNGTYTPVCRTRADLNFSLTTSGTMTDIFRLLNAHHIRHLVNEYIRRYCDKANNNIQCTQYAGAIRDMVISVTIECSTNSTNDTNDTTVIRVNGGDQRCDGRWGVDGDEYEWFNGSVVADPDSCTIRVMISIAIDNDDINTNTTNTTSSSSPFSVQSFMLRTFASSSDSTVSTSAMIRSALDNDDETLGDGLKANFDGSTDMSAAPQLLISPFVILVTMITALLA